LPAPVAAVARVLWFPYVLSFPVEVLTGAVRTSDQYLHGFAGQAAWLGLWALAYAVLWRRGVRHYGAVGG
jgi:ABC-2 type transport system permease protein